MKLKLNLKAVGFKGLAIQHGEKAAFGLGVLGLLYFIYAAAGTEVLGPDKQPEKLSQAAVQAKQYVLNSKWNPKAKGVEVVDYVSRAKRDPLSDRDYRVATLFDKPLWELKGKRPEPSVIAVEKLQASAGIGILALAPPEAIEDDDGPAVPRGPAGMVPGGPGRRGPSGRPATPTATDPGAERPIRNVGGVEVQRGVRAGNTSNLKGFGWAAITGLVPVKKQEGEFEDAFRNVLAQYPDKDLPEYILPKIERTEVNADGKESPWQDIDLGRKGAAQKLVQQWQVDYPEIIEEDYVDPLFTWRLGPLVGEDWSPAAVGHPDVPLVLKRQPRAKVAVDDDEAADEDEEEAAMGRRRPGGNRIADVAPGGSERTRTRRRPGGPARKAVDFSLFRFVDYTVQPGKQYRYRVKLRLKNPNFEVAEKFLKDPAARTKKYLESAWTEPTPVVKVPREISVLAGAVPRYTPRDPQVKLLVVSMDLANGRKVPGEETFGRGAQINFNKSVWVPDPARGVAHKVDDAEFASNSVLVDIDGGKPLSKNRRDNLLTEPSEVVILQPDGRLVARDELDDEAQVSENLGPSVDEDAALPGALPSLGSPEDDPYAKMPKHKSKVPGTVAVPGKKTKPPKAVAPPVEKPVRKKPAA